MFWVSGCLLPPSFPGQESRKLKVTRDTPPPCWGLWLASGRRGGPRPDHPRAPGLQLSFTLLGFYQPPCPELPLHGTVLLPCPEEGAPHLLLTSVFACSPGTVSYRMGSMGTCGKIFCSAPKLGFWLSLPWGHLPGLAPTGKGYRKQWNISWFHASKNIIPIGNKTHCLVTFLYFNNILWTSPRDSSLPPSCLTMLFIPSSHLKLSRYLTGHFLSTGLLRAPAPRTRWQFCRGSFKGAPPATLRSHLQAYWLVTEQGLFWNKNLS